MNSDQRNSSERRSSVLSKLKLSPGDATRGRNSSQVPQQHRESAGYQKLRESKLSLFKTVNHRSGHHMSVSSGSSQRNQIGLSTDQSGRNFNSAKARLNNPTTHTSDGGRMDPIFIVNEGASHLKEPTKMSTAQLQRIRDALKKPKDVFGEVEQKSVRIASYVLGKNERHRNPSKTRSSPNLPKAANKTAPISQKMKQPRSLQRDSSLRQVQTKVMMGSKMKPPTAQKPAGGKPVVVMPKRHGAATPAQNAFSNLKKPAQLPSAFKPINSSKSMPNLLYDDSKLSSTIMLPIISTNSSNADLQSVGFEAPNTKNQDLLTEVDQPKTSSLRNKSKGKKSMKRHPSETETVQLPEGMDTIDMEFFKKNNVTRFNDVNHVEKVLEKAFPSSNKEERDLERIIKSQTFLYEAYLDVDAVDERAGQHAKQDAGEDGQALRQATFGGEGGDVQARGGADPNRQLLSYETTPLPRIQENERSANTTMLMTQSETLQPWAVATVNKPMNYNTEPDEQQQHFADIVQQSLSSKKQSPYLKTNISRPPIQNAIFRIKDNPASSSIHLRTRQLTPSSFQVNSQSSLNYTAHSLVNQLKMRTSESNPNIKTDEVLQAFLTEQSSEQLPALLHNNSNLIQAQKLAYMLNKHQDQRSSSVPRNAAATQANKTPLLSKQLKESTASALAKTGQIAPKEFLQRIDSEIRQKSIEKMESLKMTHKDGFNLLEKCGIQESVESKEAGNAENKDGGTPVAARRVNRQNSQFSQNVREMNFFSVFVNTSVDGKIEAQKLGTEESSIVAENLNRDNKETSVISFDKSFWGGNNRDVLNTSLKHQVPKQDQKDEKFQNLPPSSACQCHSLSNEAIRKLVLESPIKDIVEQVHTHQSFHSISPIPTTTTGQSKKIDQKQSDLLKKALENHNAHGSSQKINDRTDVSVLNILLNQILTGKYSYDKKKIDEFAKLNMTERLDRFLKGINFKEMLNEVQQEILAKQEGVLEKVNESDDDEDINLQDFFFLSDIKEKESVLGELLETRKMPHKKFQVGEAATFLTQIFKESDHTQKEMAEKFPNWAKARNIMQISQEIISDHATSKENVANQKKINNEKLKREKEVRSLFDQIHNMAEEVQQTSINFFQDQTTLKPEQQANNAGKEQLLYLCFLEIVRQVSGQCKEQALFLVKLWHAYFDHYQQHMKRTLQKTGEHTNSISHLLEQMTQKFAKVLVIDESKDLEFLALIDKHDKALQLLELVSKNLYVEREHTKRLQLEIDTLKDNFSDVLPNYEKYFKDFELRQRLMRFSVQENTDTWEHSERQQLHLTSFIKKAMDEQMERDPFQARIIKDIYRIQSVCTMRMPVDYALENAKEAFQKSSVALKMKEIYHKNLQERAQRLKRQNEELIKRLHSQKESYDIELIQKEHHAKERITKAVKQFRQEQLKSILSEPKEVQTDQELIEKYFIDLENQRELGIRAMMVSRKLTGMQMQQLRVMKAFEKNPKFKHLTKPIVHIMRLVRDDKSDYPAKTLKKTLEVIAEAITERLNLFNEPTNNFKVDYLNLEHFYSKFMSNKYGIDQLALKYTEQWLVSIKAHSGRDYRVSLFMRFLGLGGYHSLPFSVFTYYLHLIKSTNMDVEYIYKKEYDDDDVITLSYQKVIFGFKDLIAKTNIFNKRNIMMQMRHASKITAQNPVVLRELSFSMFETYRYLLEKVLKSQKYRSFSELLNALFEQHSYHMENEKKKSPNNKKKRGLRRGATISVSRSGTADKEDFLSFPETVKELSPSREGEESGSKEKEVYFETPKKLGHLDTIVDEVTNVENYMDSEAQHTKSAKIGEEHLTRQPIRQADAAEDEKDFVNLKSMVKFFLTELHMTRPSDEQRLKDLLNVILISAQGARRDRILRNSALRCFTEKIDIQIPLDHYFHIGINAQIDHENSENMWLEKVFNFYSQLRTDNYKAVSGMDPDHKLVFSGEHTYDGLEFVQFYIFVKDGGSKYRKDQVMIFQIYEDECSQKNRQRLSCDDFIELIRKFNLIKSKGYFENNMRIRYEQAKGRTVHVDYLNKSTQMGGQIDETYYPLVTSEAVSQTTTKRSKSKLDGRSHSRLQNNSISLEMTPTKIKFKDLTDLASVEDSPSKGEKSKNDTTMARSLKKQSSFERQFEASKIPFKSSLNSTSMVNLITPTSMGKGNALHNSNTPDAATIIESVNINVNDTATGAARAEKHPDETADEADQAQQYLLTSKEDGSLEMSQEPNLGPSMLDMAAQTNSSKFPTMEQAKAAETNNNVAIKDEEGKQEVDVDLLKAATAEQEQQIADLDIITFINTTPGEEEAPLEQKTKQAETTKQDNSQVSNQVQFTQRPPSPIIQTEQSRIIDQDVQDTINKINSQLNQPIKTYEQMRKQALQKSSGPGVTLEEDEEEFTDEVIIESAVQNLEWHEKKLGGKKIKLSRQETMKGHAIANVNLVSYKQPSKTMVEQEIEKLYQPQSLELQKKDSIDSELGYLNLMFGTGPNNMKLQEMTEQAIEYVEREMQQKKSSTLIVIPDGVATPLADFSPTEKGLKQKSSSKKAAASQLKVSEANSKSEQSELTSSLQQSVKSSDQDLNIMIIDEDNNIQTEQPATAGLPSKPDRQLLKFTMSPLNSKIALTAKTGNQTNNTQQQMEATKQFHRVMDSGISEWHKGGQTEISIGEKSMRPSRHSTDKTFERSQTMNNYMEMESRRSSNKKTLDEMKSNLKKPRKMVKKKKKKMVKMTQSMVIRRMPSTNEDISGILDSAHKRVAQQNLNNGDNDREEKKMVAQTPAVSEGGGGRSSRSRDDDNQISFADESKTGKSSPVVSFKQNDSINRSRLSKHKSHNDLINASSSLKTYLTKVEEDSSVHPLVDYQRITPGFALAEGQFTATAAGATGDSFPPQKDPAARLLDASSGLHPVDFNYGNTEPQAAPQTEKELKDAKQLGYELKMLEKREMEAFMQRNKQGFFTEHTYDDDDEFFGRQASEDDDDEDK